MKWWYVLLLFTHICGLDKRWLKSRGLSLSIDQEIEARSNGTTTH